MCTGNTVYGIKENRYEFRETVNLGADLYFVEILGRQVLRMKNILPVINSFWLL